MFPVAATCMEGSLPVRTAISSYAVIDIMAAEYKSGIRVQVSLHEIFTA